MAERPIWRGQLRLALVSCPVALHTAQRDRSTIHTHFINPETGNRVRMASLDAETGTEIARRDLAKGYEFEKGRYLTLTDDDFDAARIPSSSTMSITSFVPLEAIDPVYFDHSYYCTPDGDSGADVYVVLRDAIRASGHAALTRIVIARRERAIAILPMDRGLIAHVLHDAADIAKPDFDAIPTAKPDPEMVKLATQLIDRQVAAFDPADLKDRYEARLREVIDAKLHDRDLAPADEPADTGNVVDLMAALRRSLGQTAPAPAPAASPKGKARKPKPATAEAAAPTRPRRPARASR